MCVRVCVCEREREQCPARLCPLQARPQSRQHASISLSLSLNLTLSLSHSLTLSLPPSQHHQRQKKIMEQRDRWNAVEGEIPNSALLKLTDYSQVDMLGSRCRSVNFGAEKSPRSPNW